MAAPDKPFSSIAEQVAARGLLGSARAIMDPFARELFDLWFSGEAPAEVVFETKAWADYMAADQGLGAQIDFHLSRRAMRFRDEMALRVADLVVGGPPLATPFKTRFHAEVGSATGGYNTGYTVLHGSNKDVGDFEISGTLVFSRSREDSNKLIASYRNNLLVFNDVVDPNFRYASDATFANLAKNLSVALGKAKPRDYIARIRWMEAGPWDYEIAATTRPGAPDWLKTFPNR